MKRSVITRFFVTMLFVISNVVVSAQSFGAWVSDTDDYTNIRNNPSGAIVGALDNRMGTWCMEITEIRNGWCRISLETLNVAEIDSVAPNLKPSETGYWIHSSMIGFTGLGESHVTLRSEPSQNGKIILDKDNINVHPIEMRGDWIKVKTYDGKYVGWMQNTEVCANPLTNCC